MTTTNHTSLTDEQIRNIENDQAKMPGVTRENLTARTVRAALIAQHGFCLDEDQCTCAREIGYRVCQPSNRTSPSSEDATCSTCNGHGMIGGPSYYSPDEGGEPCPDCNVPQIGEDAANGAPLPAWFDTFLTNVCEIPDRNSPEDEPEAIVATLEELKSCAMNAIEQCSVANGAAGEREAFINGLSRTQCNAIEYFVTQMRGVDSAAYVDMFDAFRDYINSLVGPVKARAALPAEKVAAEPVAVCTHTTQPGESVMGIALRQCGDENEWRHILACNPKFADLLPSDYFPVGTVLKLPAAPQPAQTQVAAEPVAHTLSGFMAAHLALTGYPPTDQEIFNAGVRAGKDLAAPPAQTQVALTDEQLLELRRIARTYNEHGFPKHAREFFARALLAAQPESGGKS